MSKQFLKFINSESRKYLYSILIISVPISLIITKFEDIGYLYFYSGYTLILVCVVASIFKRIEKEADKIYRRHD